MKLFKSGFPYIILNKYVVGWSNKIRAHTNYYINK